MFFGGFIYYIIEDQWRKELDISNSHSVNEGFEQYFSVKGYLMSITQAMPSESINLINI